MTGLPKQRRSTVWVAATMSACLALAACHSSTAAGSGGITAAGSATPTTGATSGAPTTTTTTPATQSTHTTSSGGGNNGNPSGPLTVDVNVVPVESVTTLSCPHTFNVQAAITVSKGPTTIKYEWVRSDGSSQQNLTSVFSGKGLQTNNVVDSFQPPAIPNALYRDTLVVIGTYYKALHNVTSFSLTCGTTLVGLVASPAPSTGCPFITTFAGTIRGYGPQQVTYQWHFADGGVGGMHSKSEPAGFFAFTVTEPKYVPDSLDGMSAYLRVSSSPTYTSPTVGVGCN